ncbi:MAG: hypothetical protein ACK5KR_09085 [Breznakia sp.]
MPLIYPKPIMRVTELVAMGFDRATLVRWMEESDFPKRRMGLNPKSPWGIPTAAFEQWQIERGLVPCKKDTD